MVFLHGHGFWTSLENVIVGPLIAIVSFVCSIGNVPLAAALWKRGISFGGVISFIFADLISLPLLLIYRRYYGTRMTVRMLVTFWAAMSAAGSSPKDLLGRRRSSRTTRPRPSLPPTSLELHDVPQHRLPRPVRPPLLGLPEPRPPGRWARYALDPVCGMQVQTANAPASLVHGGGSSTSVRTTAGCASRSASRFSEKADKAEMVRQHAERGR